MSIASLISSSALIAQQGYPREVRADERITLDSSLPLKTALDILSQYSLKHDGKIIINTTGKNTPINVLVNNMYWKRALEYILRSNLMKFEARDKYYEVVPLITSSSPEGGSAIGSQTREIEINAIFFEADYNTAAGAGIDWSLTKSDGNVLVGGAFAATPGTNVFSAQYRKLVNNFDILAIIRAFESINKGEVIANPQIKVLDGEEGKIKVGQNFFLTTADFAGNTRFTEYESGIILTVVPTVMGPSDSLFVHLDIQAERSNVVPDALQVSKSITESNTQVLLLSGEETVMAGMFSNTETSFRKGIPLLKDLPPWFFGLRYLFGTNQTSVQKKELVIILQANILPTVAERIAARATNRKVYIDQKRQEFLRKMRQLKAPNSKSTNGTGRPVKRRRR